ncbi:MAG: hypothetical protein ACI4EV_06280 [Lachnospiraceae bacterium]
MLKNYMKTLLIIIGMVCIITGCDNAEKNHSDNKKEDVIEKSTSAEDGVLTVDAIKKSEKFLKFFYFV